MAIKTPDWFRRLTGKNIGFMDSITIVITLITLIIVGSNKEWSIALIIYRFGIMLPILYIRSLLSNDYSGIEGKLTHVWEISETNGITVSEKFELIKSHLSASVERWVKYWRMFQAIVNGDTSYKKKWNMTKALLKKIYEGEIGMFQLIWISSYIFYSIVISTNVLEVPRPVDIFINIAFLTILLYASGNIIGLGKFLFDIFGILAPVATEGDIEKRLVELQEKIVRDAHTYYWLDSNLMKNETPPSNET